MPAVDQTFATVVSLLPFELVETKPGLNPNEYIIPAAPERGVACAVIPNDVFYLINPDPLSDAKEVRNIKVPVPAIELAQAIITDYVGSLIGVEVPVKVPGLFAIKGDYRDPKVVSMSFAKQVEAYRNAQIGWFQNLVAIADDTWAKTKSPLGISDMQRSACQWLGFRRDWMNPIPSELLDQCPICKSNINPGALKCIACGHVINKAEYDKVMATAK